MRWRHVARWLLPFLGGLLFLTDTTATARTKDSLRSFYVVRFSFSDYVSAWNHTFLDVTPVGADVRVRLIRMSLAHPSCGALLIQAVEHVFPHTTVAKVVGTDVCANTEASVGAALASAKTRSTITEAASQIIVGRCGEQEKVFAFPFDVSIDQAKLKRSAPAVASLGETISRVRDLAFGKSFWFLSPTPAQQIDMENLGLKVVPELSSGKYAAAFDGWTCFDQPNKKCLPNYLAWRLQGYRLPPPGERDLLPPELVDQASLHLTTYVPPVYPSIAQAARVQGDVQLSLAADPQTGAVTRVELMKGWPLLNQAAVEAARSWQFAPEFLTGQPIEATLRFQLRCWGE